MVEFLILVIFVLLAIGASLRLRYSKENEDRWKTLLARVRQIEDDIRGLRKATAPTAEPARSERSAIAAEKIPPPAVVPAMPLAPKAAVETISYWSV